MSRSGAAAAAAVAGGVLALALPHALADWQLTPDAIEYLGIAHSFASGAGFVDPIVYSHYLPPVYPMPGAAARPPLFPLLLSGPLALGASIEQLGVLHVVWAALVAAGVFAVAARWTGVAGALAAGIGLGWAFGWTALARLLLTEATSTALVLALIVVAPRALRSPRAAAGFGALVAAAWLGRPNLSLALPALLAVSLTSLGPRATLRSRPVWIATLGFALPLAACYAALLAATGLAPYAHHGVLMETLGAEDARFYQREYVGALAYLRAHEADVSRLLVWNVRHVAQSLFLLPDWHFVGWLCVPALARGLLARGRAPLERRFTAWLVLSQIVPAFVVPGSVEPMRLSLFFALGGWLLGAELLGAGLAALAARLGRERPRLGRLLPAAAPALALAAFACSPSATYQLSTALDAWRSYRAYGTRARGPGWVQAAQVCPLLEADALVASADPWAVYLFCGNLGLWLPVDLDSPAWVDRYLDEQAPALVAVDRSAPYAVLRRSARLEELGSAGGLTVYRLKDAPPRSRPWHAPPPLAARSDIRPEDGSPFSRRKVRVR